MCAGFRKHGTNYQFVYVRFSGVLLLKEEAITHNGQMFMTVCLTRKTTANWHKHGVICWPGYTDKLNYETQFLNLKQGSVGKKDYIFSDQLSMFGKREIIGFGSTDFFIKEISRDLANEIIIKNHYSKKVFNNSYIHLGCFINDELLGVLQFGHLLNNLSVSNLVADTKPGEALELNRMWFDDKAARNSESMGLSYCIKYIRGKFKIVKWIQSFADQRCGGFGIVYQSANFSYYGEHTSDFYEIDGEFFHQIMLTNNGRSASNSAKAKSLKERKDTAIVHTFRQFRYIYFVNPKIKKLCQLNECQYPKHYAGGAVLNSKTLTE